MKKLVNTALGIICACGVIAGAVGPCWVTILGILISTAAALALLELNGNHVTTY